MTVSAALTAVVTVLYTAIAAAHFAGGRPGLGLAFAGYALANIGLIMAEGGS